MPPSSTWSFAGQRVTTAILVGSVLANIAMVAYVFNLRRTLLRPGQTRPVVGSRIVSFHAKDDRSQEITVGIPYRAESLLYVFSPGCGFCVKNEAALLALTQALGGRYRILRVALTRIGLEEYIQRHVIAGPVLIEPDVTLMQTLRLGTTPQTFVLSREGAVLKMWTGTFEGVVRQDIEEYFGVHL